MWAVPLQASALSLSGFRSLLSTAEKQRAEKFVFGRHREPFEISQGVLRVLLGQYLQCLPGEVAFTAAASGKPGVYGEHRLRFNKSHSGQLALFAFALDCEIGVDVENYREIPGTERVASRYFCPVESSQIAAEANERSRNGAFLRCWTRKEAYLKAVGDGLQAPLDQCEVTLSPQDPVRFLKISGDEKLASEWSLHHLEPAPGYVGALAYRAPQKILRFPGVRTYS